MRTFARRANLTFELRSYKTTAIPLTVTATTCCVTVRPHRPEFLLLYLVDLTSIIVMCYLLLEWLILLQQDPHLFPASYAYVNGTSSHKKILLITIPLTNLSRPSDDRLDTRSIPKDGALFAVVATIVSRRHWAYVSNLKHHENQKQRFNRFGLSHPIYTSCCEWSIVSLFVQALSLYASWQSTRDFASQRLVYYPLARNKPARIAR